MAEVNTRPPRDNLVRMARDGYELREAGDGGMPTLVSEFAVFDEWTEIDSWFEGRFLEKIQRGAFRKTMRENRSQIKPLFQHGQDPTVGSKPLGQITDLREDESHAVGEVELLDTAYNRELIPGLEAGLYGSSFRFQVLRENINQEPGASDDNPEGLPERTITELRLFEFGPVTFPAYTSTTAGVRSLTIPELRLGVALDEKELARLAAERTSIAIPAGIPKPERSDDDEPETDDASEPEGDTERPTDQVEDEAQAPSGEEAPVEGDAGSRSHLPDDAPLSEAQAAASSTTEASDPKENEMRTIEEITARLAEIREGLTQIHTEYGAEMLPSDVSERFDALTTERADLEAQAEAFERRAAVVAAYANENGKSEREDVGRSVPTGKTRGGLPRTHSRVPADPFAVEEYRSLAGNDRDQVRQAFRDGALAAIDGMRFPHERAEPAKVKSHVERLLSKDSRDSEIALRILTCGSPLYERAFGKVLIGQPLTGEEVRAMSLTDTAGGYAVPVALDPTVIPTSDGAINPLRQISNIKTITSDTWKGVASEGVVAHRNNEAAQSVDGAPTFDQPEIKPGRVDVWIPFSYEIGMDFGSIASELAQMISDAKDAEEAASYTNGAGNGVTGVMGVVAGLALTSHVTSNTINAFGVEDLYKLKNALPPRFRGRAAFLANDSFYSEIRQLDTYGGSSFWTNLGNDTPERLLGKPTYEASEMAGTSDSGDDVLLYGDFSYYAIVDRVGMSIELIPQVFGGNQRPTGQKGFFAFWRNGAAILSDNAFRLLTIGLTS